jgi:ATP-dependent RNA helicase RhlE
MTISADFASLGLAQPILRAVAETGYTTPTPIQAQAIPLVLAGRDLLAAAQTGTGKTAGFTLPLLHLLSTTQAAERRSGRPRCLVLTPTRELAAQVHESVETYGRHLPLKSMVMFGGVNINPQFQTLRKQVDILVATPGRLLDHAGQKTVDLSGVEILVLDEADRMLDMGFIRDIRKVLAMLPKKRQNLLFSATFSDEIRSLAKGLLNDPGQVEVARRNTASELVSQSVFMIPQKQKRDLLVHLIGQNQWYQVLVFTRTKHGANKLAEYLVKHDIAAAAIHGNKSQAARTRALAQFKDGSLPVLVATDIAARGLDIEQLPHVINFELPNIAEDYVHRIGRTGRAGSTGHAISLVDAEEAGYLSGIERLIGKRIERAPQPEGFTPRPVDPNSQESERPRQNGRPPRNREADRRNPREPGKRTGKPQQAGTGRASGSAPRDGQANRDRAVQPRATGTPAAAPSGNRRQGQRSAPTAALFAPRSANRGR